jgi:DNA-binding transcriptional LysR family regulator
VLVEHARAVLDRLEEAEADVARSLTTVGGTVRIAVFQSAAHAVVPHALTLLAAEHPALRVEVTEREPELALFDVAARDFDLVIAEQYPGHTRAHRDDLDRVHLAADAIRLALPPDGALPRPAEDALAAASAMPWVLEPEGTASRQWAEQLCRDAGFEPDVRFETADLMAHIRLIRSGNAVGLLPDLVWAGEAPSVTLVDLPGHPEREVFTSTRLAAAARPAVVACRDAFARAARATATPAGHGGRRPLRPQDSDAGRPQALSSAPAPIR